MSIAPNEGGVAHVGLPKAASTYLQKHYFSKLSLPFFSTEHPFVWPHALDFVRTGNSLWYDDLIGAGGVLARQDRQRRYTEKTYAYLARWQEGVRAFAAKRWGHGSWLASAEGLCGLSAQVAALNMSLLKQAGVAKVIFVCRRQADYAKSLWRQFLLAEDRFARFVPFETLFGTGKLEGEVDLDWNLYVQSMDAQFGSENVLVLPYEFLVSDPAAFFRCINTFLGLPGDIFIPDPGIRENPSRNESSYHGLSIDFSFPLDRLPGLRRRLHRMAARYPWIAPRLFRMEHPMVVSSEVLADLQRHLAAANLQLEARIGIDLKNYGYY